MDLTLSNLFIPESEFGAVDCEERIVRCLAPYHEIVTLVQQVDSSSLVLLLEPVEVVLWLRCLLVELRLKRVIEEVMSETDIH